MEPKDGKSVHHCMISFWSNGLELIRKPEWVLGGMIRKTHKEV